MTLMQLLEKYCGRVNWKSDIFQKEVLAILFLSHSKLVNTLKGVGEQFHRGASSI